MCFAFVTVSLATRLDTSVSAGLFKHKNGDIKRPIIVSESLRLDKSRLLGSALLLGRGEHLPHLPSALHELYAGAAGVGPPLVNFQAPKPFYHQHSRGADALRLVTNDP